MLQAQELVPVPVPVLAPPPVATLPVAQESTRPKATPALSLTTLTATMVATTTKPKLTLAATQMARAAPAAPRQTLVRATRVAVDSQCL